MKITLSLIITIFFSISVYGDDLVRFNISKDINKIIVHLDGSSTIKLVQSDGEFAVSNLKYTHINYNPVKVKTEKDSILLTQQAKLGEDNSFTTSFVLTIPKDKELEFSCGVLSISGSISVNSLKIQCGVLKANLNLSKCKKSKISFGTASGTLVVPKNCEIKGVPVWSALKIVKRGQ